MGRLAGTRFAVLIPTYNRPQMLDLLLHDLYQESDGAELFIQVFDDGSKEQHRPAYKRLAKRHHGVVFYWMTHHGKQGYWSLVNDMFETLTDEYYDYLLYLADDYRLVPEALWKAVDIWNSIEDPQKTALNIALDKQREGKRNWSRRTPTKIRAGRHEVWWTHWVDMAFLSTRRLLESLEHRILRVPTSRWVKHPQLSSGVGEQITMRLQYGHGLYQVAETLVTHGGHKSMMHPGERKTNPLTTFSETDIIQVRNPNGGNMWISRSRYDPDEHEAV